MMDGRNDKRLKPITVNGHGLDIGRELEQAILNDAAKRGIPAEDAIANVRRQAGPAGVINLNRIDITADLEAAMKKEPSAKKG